MWTVVDWCNGMSALRECATEEEARKCFISAPFAGTGTRELRNPDWDLVESQEIIEE